MLYLIEYYSHLLIYSESNEGTETGNFRKQILPINNFKGNLFTMVRLTTQSIKGNRTYASFIYHPSLKCTPKRSEYDTSSKS